MKAVMLSIRPEWCKKIACGEKTVEVRKTRPKQEPPFKCYIYCTKPSKRAQTICGAQIINTDELYRLPSKEIKHGYSGEIMLYPSGQWDDNNFLSGKVIGEFLCRRIEDYSEWKYDLPSLYRHVNLFAHIDYPELYEYLPNGGGYGWHISDLKIYDEPKTITEFLSVDKHAVKNCPYRERTGQAEIVTRHNGWIKGSYLCLIDGITWCYPCHTKNLERAPQSWCYVEDTINGE